MYSRREKQDAHEFVRSHVRLHMRRVEKIHCQFLLMVLYDQTQTHTWNGNLKDKKLSPPTTHLISLLGMYYQIPQNQFIELAPQSLVVFAFSINLLQVGASVLYPTFKCQGLLMEKSPFSIVVLPLSSGRNHIHSRYV